jgi:peptide subunit release factor RF-3
VTHRHGAIEIRRQRPGKEMRPNSVVSFLSQRRELLDEAFAGGIVGIPNHGVLHLGDAMTQGEARAMPSCFRIARRVTCDDAKELQRYIDANAHRVAYDTGDAPTLLVEYSPELRAIEANWLEIEFHALREHAGLVFQKKLEG